MKRSLLLVLSVLMVGGLFAAPASALTKSGEIVSVYKGSLTLADVHGTKYTFSIGRTKITLDGAATSIGYLQPGYSASIGFYSYSSPTTASATSVTASRNPVFRGTVTSNVKGSIALKDASGISRTFGSATAKATLNGSATYVSSVKPGLLAQVVYKLLKSKTGAAYEAVTIEAVTSGSTKETTTETSKTAASTSEPETTSSVFKGQIAALDLYSVTVKDGSGLAMKFKLARDAQILLNGRLVSVKYLKLGMAATVEHTSSTATKVSATG